MRQKKFWLSVALLLGLFVFAVEPAAVMLAQAQNSVKVGSRLYRKKTVISFGSDTISGDLTRPDGEYFEARKRLKHDKLIKLRQHWKKKIRQAVNDL